MRQILLHARGTEGIHEMGGIYGRQQHQSPETEVGVAGHRAGMPEPEDEGRTRESSESVAREVEYLREPVIFLPLLTAGRA